VAESSVAIRRIDSEYRIPSDHPEPFALRDRLDGILRSHVNRSLAYALRYGISASDESLLFIRNIDIDIVLNADWSDREIADVWAEAIARSIAQSVRRRTMGEESAWFASHVEYLAEYIRQTSAGTAANRWYFQTFEGLRLLSASAAIRTALSRNSSEGLAALHSLSVQDLTATLNVMTRADIRRALEILFTGGLTSSDAMARVIVHTWNTGPVTPTAYAEDEPACVMQLCIEVTRDRARFAGEALVNAAKALVRLVRLMQVSDAAVIRHAVKAGEVAALYLAAGASDGEVIAPICAWPADIRFEVTRRPDEQSDAGTPYETHAKYPGASPVDVAGNTGSPTPHSATETGASSVCVAAKPAAGSSAGETDLKGTALSGVDGSRGQPELTRLPAESTAENILLHTSFGGLFLLLPSLDEMLPADLLAVWPGIENCSAAAILRLLVISRCFSRRRAGAASADQAVKQMVGASAITLRALADWQAAIKPRMWKDLAHRLSSRATGLNPAVLVSSIPTPGGKTAIAIESGRGLWLSAVSYKQGGCTGPAARVVRSVETADVIAVQDPLLASSLVNAGCSGQVVDIAERLPDAFASDTALADQVARIHRLPDEFRYLAGQPPYGLTHDADLTIRVLAQNMMRLFAARLPGFAQSSLDHLNTNFLAFSATAEFEPSGRIVVRTSRPPLHLILSLTGISRGSYRLSWMPQSTIALYPEA
jgi:hypothetical protein